MPAKPVVETESGPKSNDDTVSVRRSRRVWFVVLSVIIAVSISLCTALAYYFSGNSASLGSRVIKLEVVDSPELRERGLSGRENLAEDRGMLFVFEEPGKHCFWMKDMHFAIDMIWLDSQKRVVHMQKNAQPSSYPESFCPPELAKYVIEVAAGIADKSGLKQGDQVHTRFGLVL